MNCTSTVNHHLMIKKQTVKKISWGATFLEHNYLRHEMACKQQAIATTLCEELEASNCVSKSQGAPARGIRPPPV